MPHEIARFESNVQAVSHVTERDMLGFSLVYSGLIQIAKTAAVAVPNDVQETGLWLVNEMTETRQNSLRLLDD